VKKEDISSMGGQLLLEKYDDSMEKLLRSVYPNYDWKPWLFNRVCNGFWANEGNMDQYLAWLSDQLHVHFPEDLLSISVGMDSSWNNPSHANIEEILDMGGSFALKYFGGLPTLLTKLYPQHAEILYGRAFMPKSQVPYLHS
jgi:hypothetical protein